MNNNIFKKLFFYSKSIFLFNDAKISVNDLAPVASKKEKGEQGKLDIAGLVDEANLRMTQHQKMLNEMPKQYSSDFKKALVRYFINSADRFDRDQEKGLDKYEFAQYKHSMLTHISRITQNHKPSKAEKAAAERERAKFEAARRKFEASMRAEIAKSNYGSKLNTADLEKKGRIPREMFKVQKDTAWVNERVQSVSDQIARFMPQLQKWNSMNGGARHANQGLRTAVTGSMATIRRAKTEVLPKLRDAQREIHEHGKKLCEAAKSLKEKFLKKRDETLKKAEARIKRKRNEGAYKLLSKAKERFRLKAGVTPEAAIKKIDHIMANPFKYGITPEGMKKLIQQRGTIAKLTGRPVKPSGFDYELFDLNQKVGRTLEIEQQKNGSIKEMLMAKFAPVEDALNKQIKDVNDLALQTDTQNSMLINQMEKSVNSFLSTSVKKVNTGFLSNVTNATYNIWHFSWGKVGQGIKYPFGKAAGGMYKAADYLSGTSHFKWLGSACDFVGGTVDSLGELGKSLAMLAQSPFAAAKGLGTLALGWTWDADKCGKMWEGLGKHIFATDDFGKGKYARGSGKAFGNLATFLLTGGTAAGFKTASITGKLGRALSATGRLTSKLVKPARGVAGKLVKTPKGWIQKGAEALRRGSKAPASARSAAGAATVSAPAVVAAAPAVSRTAALANAVKGLSATAATKLKNWLVKTKARISDRLGTMSNKAAYDAYYGIVKQIQKQTGKTLTQARQLAQKEFGPLWEKAKAYVKSGKIETSRVSPTIITKSQQGVISVFESLGKGAQAGLLKLKAPFVKFNQLIKDKISKGMSARAARKAAAKENPGLASQAKQFAEKTAKASESVYGVGRIREWFQKLHWKTKTNWQKLKNYTGNKRADLAEAARYKTADLKLRIPDAASAALGWSSKRMGSFKDALAQLPRRIRNSLNGRASYLKYETKVSEFMNKGLTRIQATIKAGRELPSRVVKEAKEFIRTVELNVQKTIVRDLAKSLKITGREKAVEAYIAVNKLRAYISTKFNFKPAHIEEAIKAAFRKLWKRSEAFKTSKPSLAAKLKGQTIEAAKAAAAGVSSATLTIPGLASRVVTKLKTMGRFFNNHRKALQTRLGSMSKKQLQHEEIMIIARIRKHLNCSIDDAIKIARSEFKPLLDKLRPGMFARVADKMRANFYKAKDVFRKKNPIEIEFKRLDRLTKKGFEPGKKVKIYRDGQPILCEIESIGTSGVRVLYESRTGFANFGGLDIPLKQFAKWNKRPLTAKGVERVLTAMKRVPKATLRQKIQQLIERYRAKSAAPATARKAAAPKAATKTGMESAMQQFNAFENMGFRNQSQVVIMRNGKPVLCNIKSYSTRGVEVVYAPQTGWANVGTMRIPMKKIIKWNKEGPLTTKAAQKVLKQMGIKGPKGASEAVSKAVPKSRLERLRPQYEAFEKMGFKNQSQVVIMRDGKPVLCNIQSYNVGGARVVYAPQTGWANAGTIKVPLTDIMKWNKGGPLTEKGAQAVLKQMGIKGPKGANTAKYRISPNNYKIPASTEVRGAVGSKAGNKASGTIGEKTIKETAARNKRNAAKKKREGNEFRDN